VNTATDETESRVFIVLKNAEEQFSLWPKGKEIPKGWTSVGMEGSEDACSKYVDEVWTDMRPLSLRKRMSAEGETRSS
jgi:MbtH protein